jgi:hypothetical protein
VKDLTNRAGVGVPVSVGIRLKLWGGVLRRFFLYLFRRSYIERSIAVRKGKCSRCGVCCRLTLDPCGGLCFDETGKSYCSKYEGFRPPNCRIFPIDKQDIADRDLVAPKNVPCGYYF